MTAGDLPMHHAPECVHSLPASLPASLPGLAHQLLLLGKLFCFTFLNSDGQEDRSD